MVSFHHNSISCLFEFRVAYARVCAQNYIKNSTPTFTTAFIKCKNKSQQFLVKHQFPNRTHIQIKVVEVC